MNRLLQKSIVGLSLFPLSSITLALTVSFTQVGELTPNLDTVLRPIAVSNDGVVAMRASADDLVTWAAGSGTTVIAVANPNSWIWPTISSDGNSVLFSSFHAASGDPDSWGADYYYNDGVLQTFVEPLDGMANISAMSSDGDVLGGYTAANSDTFPALLSNDVFSQYTNIDDRQSIAALNATGDKFVTIRNYSGITNSGFSPNVWSLDGSGGATYVQSTMNMNVKGLSADGSVVLGDVPAAMYWNPHTTVLWNAETDQYTDINDLYYPIAFSSDASVVIGNSKDLNHNQSTNIMSIWDNVNGVRDIEQLVSTYGIDLSGWSNTRIQNISEDGSKIVGTGTNPDGNVRVFMLDLIAECSTYL